MATTDSKIDTNDNPESTTDDDEPKLKAVPDPQPETADEATEEEKPKSDSEPAPAKDETSEAKSDEPKSDSEPPQRERKRRGKHGKKGGKGREDKPRQAPAWSAARPKREEKKQKPKNETGQGALYRLLRTEFGIHSDRVHFVSDRPTHVVTMSYEVEKGDERHFAREQIIVDGQTRKTMDTGRKEVVPGITEQHRSYRIRYVVVVGLLVSEEEGEDKHRAVRRLFVRQDLDTDTLRHELSKLIAPLKQD